MAFMFGIGYNGQPAFEDIVAKYRARIGEVFFVAPYSHSARRVAGDAAEYIYGLRLHEMLKFLSSTDISANMLFNALCIGDAYGSSERLAAVCEQVDFYRATYGVSAVTVVSAAEGELIKTRFPEVQIHASTNMFIRTPTQAAKVKHFVDVLTPDREINRDLETLRAIKKVINKPIRVLANEGCIPECPHRIQHLNRVSHERPPQGRFHLPGGAVFRRDPATILKSPIIRPEDIHHYEGIADSIKLATRASSNHRLGLVLQAYTSERYDGDLFALMECGCLSTYLEDCRNERAGSTLGLPTFSNAAIPADFFQRTTTCDRLCAPCNYCGDIARRAFCWSDLATEVRV